MITAILKKVLTFWIRDPRLGLGVSYNTWIIWNHAAAKGHGFRVGFQSGTEPWADSHLQQHGIGFPVGLRPGEPPAVPLMRVNGF